MVDRMTKLDAIRKRLEAATPGPWRATHVSSGDYAVFNERTQRYIVGTTTDAHFIAHAPTDIAYLLRVVEVAQDLLDRIETAVDATSRCEAEQVMRWLGELLDEAE